MDIATVVAVVALCASLFVLLKWGGGLVKPCLCGHIAAEHVQYDDGKRGRCLWRRETVLSGPEETCDCAAFREATDQGVLL